MNMAWWPIKCETSNLHRLFEMVPSQYAPSFQNAKVYRKSKTMLSTADDCVIFVPNFIGVRQQMMEIDALVCQTFCRLELLLLWRACHKRYKHRDSRRYLSCTVAREKSAGVDLKPILCELTVYSSLIIPQNFSQPILCASPLQCQVNLYLEARKVSVVVILMHCRLQWE